MQRVSATSRLTMQIHSYESIIITNEARLHRGDAIIALAAWRNASQGCVCVGFLSTSKRPTHRGLVLRQTGQFFCLFLTSETHRNGIDSQARESSERRPVLSVEERFRSNWFSSNTSCKSACCWLRMRLLQAGITQQGESSGTGH